MKEIKLKGLDEVVYQDTCENGLDVYVWVNKKANAFKASLVYRCGAEDIHFTRGNKKMTVPTGTAHFLEHMMCKNSDGTSLLSKFQELEAFSNAATYPDKTVYEFVGTTNLEENLNLLLDAIQEKEFSEEAFISEKGPILEEARMQNDNNARVAMLSINACLFSKYHNAISGVGTEEDIKKMELKDLEEFYQTFYHPENSFLVVTGNVDPRVVFHTVKENQKKKNFKEWKKPKKEHYREPKKVVKEYMELEANVEIPKVYISIKIPKNKFEEEEILAVLDIFNVTLLANFGSTSLFKEEILDQKLAVSLATQAYIERDYIILQVVAKTKYPDELTPILIDKLNHIEINEKDIKRKIKAEIANLILYYEDVENVNDYFVYCLNMYQKIIDNEKKILESITISKIKTVMHDFMKNPYNIFILKPKTSKKKIG